MCRVKWLLSGSHGSWFQFIIVQRYLFVFKSCKKVLADLGLFRQGMQFEVVVTILVIVLSSDQREAGMR